MWVEKYKYTQTNSHGLNGSKFLPFLNKRLKFKWCLGKKSIITNSATSNILNQVKVLCELERMIYLGYQSVFKIVGGICYFIEWLHPETKTWHVSQLFSVDWPDLMRMMQDFMWGESSTVIHAWCDMLKSFRVSPQLSDQRESASVVWVNRQYKMRTGVSEGHSVCCASLLHSNSLNKHWVFESFQVCGQTAWAMGTHMRPFSNMHIWEGYRI